MLEHRWGEDTTICVGLDTVYDKIPECVRCPGGNPVGVGAAIVAFNRAIVEATADLVCAYKPNTAFYEAYGPEGIVALHDTIVGIHEIAPTVPVILDAKRADIGNTNAGYVTWAFDYLGTDAITVHPTLGAEALEPFLSRADKGVIVLCRTSNPGAGEFQDLIVDDEPLYLKVAGNVATKWNTNGNCAVVVGATYPNELRRVRQVVGDMPILIPGIGAQGGDVEQTVKAGRDSRGRGMIINSSRGIIFASSGADFAEAAFRETDKLDDMINQCLISTKPTKS